MVKETNMKVVAILFMVAVVLVQMTLASHHHSRGKSGSKSDKEKEDRVESNRKICELPIDNGNKYCDKKTDQKSKWYYHCDSHTCRRFEFEGCDGNDNNFDTLEDCKDKCVGEKKKKWCTTGKDDKPDERDILSKLVDALAGQGGKKKSAD